MANPKIIACDSFGVRSMATLVGNILIDPAAALGPKRYGLPPNDVELIALELARKKIYEIAKKAKKIIITHYHWDHAPHPDLDYSFFEDKEVYLKDFRDMHKSGQVRGKRVYEKIKNFTDFVEFIDGREFDDFEASIPVWHGGENSKVGKVVMIRIKDFIFGSDAQGITDDVAKEFILEREPKIIFISGYPTYLVGYKVKKKDFEKSILNLEEIISKTNIKEIILDHHAVRDIDYKEKYKELFDFSEDFGVRIITAAEFSKKENLFLEAWRKKIKEKEIEENELKEKLKLYY